MKRTTIERLVKGYKVLFAGMENVDRIDDAAMEQMREAIDAINQLDRFDNDALQKELVEVFADSIMLDVKDAKNCILNEVADSPAKTKFVLYLFNNVFNEVDGIVYLMRINSLMEGNADLRLYCDQITRYVKEVQHSLILFLSQLTDEQQVENGLEKLHRIQAAFETRYQEDVSDGEDKVNAICKRLEKATGYHYDGKLFATFKVLKAMEKSGIGLPSIKTVEDMLGYIDTHFNRLPEYELNTMIEYCVKILDGTIELDYDIKEQDQPYVEAAVDMMSRFLAERGSYTLDEVIAMVKKNL